MYTCMCTYLCVSRRLCVRARVRTCVLCVSLKDMLEEPSGELDKLGWIIDRQVFSRFFVHLPFEEEDLFNDII